MHQIYLQFKDNTFDASVYLRFQYELESILLVANNKCELVEHIGHTQTLNQLSRITNELAELANTEASIELVEKKAVELLVFSVAELLVHRNIQVDQFQNSTVECVLDVPSGGMMVNLANPNNPLRQKLMCASMHIESFSDEFYQLQRSTNLHLDTDAVVIDEVINHYRDFGEHLKGIFNFNPLIYSFIFNVQQDIAPAISLVMGGRNDAGCALARRAIEIVGFARTIIGDKEAEEIWIANNKVNTVEKAYRDRFSLKQLFPKGDAFWHGLYRRYDFFSKLSHPTPLSFSRMRWKPTEDGKLEINVRQTRCNKDDAAENVDEVWLILDTYALCLCGFEYALSAYVDTKDFHSLFADLLQKTGKLSKLYSKE